MGPSRQSATDGSDSRAREVPPARPLADQDDEPAGAVKPRFAREAPGADALAGACRDGDAGADPFAGSLPAPAPDVREVAFASDDLGALRRLVTHWATGHELDAERCNELVLAVNELTTNSVSYGGGGGTLALWREDETLLCEVRDEGRITDRSVGLVRPAPDQTGGRGLWLAHQLCDAVEIRSSSAGTVVRVHKRRG